MSEISPNSKSQQFSKSIDERIDEFKAQFDDSEFADYVVSALNDYRIGYFEIQSYMDSTLQSEDPNVAERNEQTKDAVVEIAMQLFGTPNQGKIKPYSVLMHQRNIDIAKNRLAEYDTLMPDTMQQLEAGLGEHSVIYFAGFDDKSTGIPCTIDHGYTVAISLEGWFEVPDCADDFANDQIVKQHVRHSFTPFPDHFRAPEQLEVFHLVADLAKYHQQVHRTNYEVGQQVVDMVANGQDIGDPDQYEYYRVHISFAEFRKQQHVDRGEDNE